MMWRRRRARQSAGRKEEEEDSGGGGRRRGRLERKRRVVWTSNLREQGRGLGLGRRLWLRGGRPMRRGGEELGRRRIREGVRRGGGREAVDQGEEEGCVWWRSGGGGD
jgi:hypothetical protein